MLKKAFRIADVAHLGGIARRERMTPVQRSASARRAALARHRRSTKEERSEAARRAVNARWAKPSRRKEKR